MEPNQISTPRIHQSIQPVARQCASLRISCFSLSALPGNVNILTNAGKKAGLQTRANAEEAFRQALPPLRSKDVVEAMKNVPRECFVPADDRHIAYLDIPLVIGGGQTISQPYIVGLMTEALQIQPNDRVLEVGTGSGYQAAVLAEMAHRGARRHRRTPAGVGRPSRTRAARAGLPKRSLPVVRESPGMPGGRSLRRDCSNSCGPQAATVVAGPTGFGREDGGPGGDPGATGTGPGSSHGRRLLPENAGPMPFCFRSWARTAFRRPKEWGRLGKYDGAAELAGAGRRAA